MQYDFSKIDNSNTKIPVYRLQINFNSLNLESVTPEDIRLVVDSLQQTLPFLFDDRMTFDAETLIGSAWCTDLRSEHNRTFGRILRRLVDLKMVPLVRLPKGSGSRIRFRIKL